MLDKLLVDAASEAGAEVREGFTVEEIVFEDGRVTGIRGHGKGGSTVTEHARVVDRGGRLALDCVARGRAPRAVQREAAASGELLHLLERAADARPLRGLRPPVPRLRGVAHERRPARSSSRGWPFAEFEANKRDIEGNYLKSVRPGRRASPTGSAPPRAKSASSARRCRTTSASPTVPAGRWSGDAGYNKDFITAQGIQDAFRDAELCAAALDETFSGARSFDAAMGEYQSTRDAHVLPMYEFTAQLATLEPPPPEMQQLLGGDARQPAGDGRVRARQRRRDVARRVLLRGERPADLRGGPLVS